MGKWAKNKYNKINSYRKYKENTVIKVKFTLMDVVNSTIDYIGDIYQVYAHYM